MSFLAISSLSLLTTSIVSSVIYPELLINSMSTMASGLMKSISYLISISHSDADLQQILLLSDVIEDIRILKNFIEEEQNMSSKVKTIIECIDNLSKTLFELEKNVKSITTKIEYNKTIWFSYIRSYNLNKDKELLSLLIVQLKHRFEMLSNIYSMRRLTL